MSTRTLETDYLVIGAGAAGMAFTDSLITDSKSDVIMVDRRHSPGGHWLEAYPFVRLHQPSAFYGVNSARLGNDAIDQDGLNAGFYEQASAPEICAYYSRVMNERFLASGQVRFFPMCRYLGDHRFVSGLSGDAFEVKVRKKIVDARYLETSVPNSSAPPFSVAPEVRCVPVNQLALLGEPAKYVIVGAGKTAMDACVWLLFQGVAPERIQWIKPRDAWLQNRAFLQGGELVGTFYEGLALQLEAALEANSIDELFEGLERRGQFLRVDEQVRPTMYRGPTLSLREVEELRRIKDVVRLGKVKHIEPTRVVLERGELAVGRDHLFVHCATQGLNPAPEVPIFQDDRIVLQSIRIGLLPFNAALTGFVEATRHDTQLKNRLCPPTRQPDTPTDWVRGMLNGMGADYQWSKEPDIQAWLERARLNASRGVRERMGDPHMQQVMKRFAQAARPALAKFASFL